VSQGGDLRLPTSSMPSTTSEIKPSAPTARVRAAVDTAVDMVGTGGSCANSKARATMRADEIMKIALGNTARSPGLELLPIKTPKWGALGVCTLERAHATWWG